MPKKLMKIEKHIEHEYMKKGFSEKTARKIGFATISKKYGWRRGQE